MVSRDHISKIQDERHGATPGLSPDDFELLHMCTGHIGHIHKLFYKLGLGITIAILKHHDQKQVGACSNFSKIKTFHPAGKLFKKAKTQSSFRKFLKLTIFP